MDDHFGASSRVRLQVRTSLREAPSCCRSSLLDRAREESRDKALGGSNESRELDSDQNNFNAKFLTENEGRDVFQACGICLGQEDNYLIMNVQLARSSGQFCNNFAT